MELNVKDLEALIDEMYSKIPKQTIHLYCSTSVVDYLEKHWVEREVEAKFHPIPGDDDRIFLIPAEALEKPIRVVMPEEQEKLRRYLGFESEEQ